MFSKSTIKLVLFFILFGATNSLTCQKCTANDYHTECRAGIIKEPSECSGDEVLCYKEFLYGPDTDNIPQYNRGCGSSDWCEKQKKDHENDLKTCKTCEKDMCNNGPLEDKMGIEYSGRLYCQKCNSTDYDSDCRKGTINERFECGSKEDACYEQYLLLNDNTPLYTRGCTNRNWCAIQEDNYGEDIKYCEACPGHMCNNVSLGVADSSKLQCYKCNSKDENDNNCKFGKKLNLETCEKNGNSCYEYHIRSEGSETSSRGCGPDNFCEMKKNDEDFDGSCESCDLDLCNNNHID